MSESILSDNDHITRYCSPQTLFNGNVTGTAFKLKPNENYLPVNWLEYFKKYNTIDKLKQIQISLHRKLSISKNGKIVVLNVLKTKNTGIKHKINLQIKCLNQVDDESHSGIFEYENNLEFTEQLTSS